VRVVRRLVYWWRFQTSQDELREELELHRELLTADLRRRGLAPEAADAQARRAMGNETFMREEARSVWLTSGLEGMLNDWRHAWRGLRRSPVFTALVVLIVALTIGANTAVFGVVHHLLLDPLPYPDGNRIVRLGTESVADPLAAQFGVDAEVLRRLRVRSRTLEDFAAVTRQRYRMGNEPDDGGVPVASITPSFMSMLQVRPALGRGFTPDDAIPDAEPVLMIGFGLWQLRYAGTRDIIGRVVTVNGVARTIVGIVPHGVDIPMSRNDPPDVWLPLDLESSTEFVDGFARLRSGATTAEASRELQSIVLELPATESMKGLRARATRAQDHIDPRERRAIELLFVTVSGLLLIACANIANLLLMRGWTRRRELAVRLALGAGRLRLARQMLTESVLLGVLGGGLGLLIAWRGLELLIAIYPGGLTLGGLTSLNAVRIDATILVWTAGLSVGTGLLFGVGPAFLSGDQSLGDALRTGGRTAVGSGAARRLRTGLVVAEIALSLMFLSAAGLMVRSFIALMRTPIGYDPIGFVAVTVQFERAPARADRAALEETLLRTVRAIPGVSQAASGGLPQTNVQTGPFAIEGPTGPQLLDIPFCEMPFVGAEYFRVARIPLVQGRTFDTSDPAVASRELVVNEALARRLWPGGNALGSRLRVGEGPNAKWLTVVGIAGDLHVPGMSGDLFNLQMYRPTSAASEFVTDIVLRLNRGTNAVEPKLERTLERTIERAGVSAKLRRVMTAEHVLERRVLAQPRFTLAVFGVFAMIALVVAAAGLYGVVGYAVTQRTREIGVRVALGAEPGAVARLVLGDTGRLVTVGISLGLVGAFAAARITGRFLYEVRPTDPAALGGAVLLMIVVALIATLVPMRRALRIDPMDALRTD
jgi:putative ABC transport system permease protein